MKKNALSLSALATVALLLLFFSCSRKYDDFHNPFPQDCDVASYILPSDPTDTSAYSRVKPSLFKKTYDPSGRMVTGIDFNYWNALTVPLFHEHHMLVKTDGQKIFLLDKDDNLDTAVRIFLNNQGRPLSCEINAATNDSHGDSYGELNKFVYKNNRLIAIKTTRFSEYYPLESTDSLHYDNDGNILSFSQNSYQYDLHRKARQQFYCDDLMGSTDGFYIMQYLGFFPEVTSPTNVRTYVNAVLFVGNVTDHRFDADGKLISYVFRGPNPTTITWHCKAF